MKILTIKDKQDKNGNPMKVIEVDDENKTTVFVNAKYEPKIFAVIKEDSEIEIFQDGKFWKIKPESLGITPDAPKSNYKTGQITEAVKIKAESIRHAQENRNDSIRLSSASRDASLMVTTLIPFIYKDLTEDELKAKWESWRAWFFQRIGDEPQSFSQPF